MIYTIEESTAKSLADQVRRLTGTTDEMGTDEMAIKLKSVEVGGGSGMRSVEEKDVIFIDYDGAILYSYTVDEAQALTELPPLPSHAGLICQGWNYDLETIKSYNSSMTVGAMYVTNDGTTKIYIRLEEGRTAPAMSFELTKNATITVDWGDGTTPDLILNDNDNYYDYDTMHTPKHEYANAGDYVISLTVSNGTVKISGSSSYSLLLKNKAVYGTDEADEVYTRCIYRIELGLNVVMGNYAFCSMANLNSITIPNGITQISSNAFYGCVSLHCAILPRSVTSVGVQCFYACYGLQRVSFPDEIVGAATSIFTNCMSLPRMDLPFNITSFDNIFSSCHALKSVTLPASIREITSSAFYGCHNLKNVSIPSGVELLGSHSFFACKSISSVIIPSAVTEIGYYAFSGCSGVSVFDFTTCKQVPKLVSGAFNNIASDCEIRVPSSLYNQWIVATEWSTYASKIVAV